MAKLIYIGLTISNLKLNGQFKPEYLANGDYYRSLVFTSDGHLITHGIDFSIAPSLLIGGSAGSIPYQSGTDTTTFLGIGASGSVLTSSGTAPQWTTLASSITNSSTAIPSSSAVKSYVDSSVAGLTGAMHYRGVSSTVPTESGATVSGITNFESGDVVTNGNKEYVYTGSTAGNSSSDWRELGDESSYLLKTATPLSSTTLSVGSGTIGSGITIDLSTITITNSPATGNNIVNSVTVDSYGRVTAVGYATASLTDTTHNFYLGASQAKANATSATNDPYLTTKLTSAASSANGTNIVLFKGSTYLGVSGNNGVITFTNKGVTGYTATVSSGYEIGKLKINGTDTSIYGVNTWREVDVYKIVSSALDGTIDELLSTSTGTSPLKFSATFSVNSNDEIDLVWEEIDSSGNKTYYV